MTHKKNTPKEFSKQKVKKRRLLTLGRITKYGFDNFARNLWLSIAATAVMTITLMIIFVVFAARLVLTDTITTLSDKVDMSIYLKTATTDEVGAELKAKIEALSSVKSVVYISAEEARAQIAEENKDNADVLEAIKEATNKNPATLRIVVADINDTSELEAFVDSDEQIKASLNSDYPPSFAGERRDTIKSIGRVVNFIQEVGIVIGVIFVAISSLIIFNTIQMAIFNRREEIQMMKLIGADRFFVRGPFLIEAVIYGFIAAILAGVLGIFGLYKISGVLESYQVSTAGALNYMTNFSVLIIMAMMGIGAIIGIVSSLLATRKYLRS